MQLDPQTMLIIVSVQGLVPIGLALGLWWTGRTYPGYGRWALAVSLRVMAMVLLSLGPTAPDWLSMVVANAVAAFASMLCLEGARKFRSLPAHSWFVYAGGVVTIGAVAFFVYVVPNQNGRSAVMSAFVGVVLIRAAMTLLQGVAAGPTLGQRLTGYLFALFGATNVIRAVYSAFGPPLIDPLSGVHGALFIVLTAQVFLFAVGFILIANERGMLDLMRAKERVWQADVEIAQHRAAEAVLRESERQFRTLANAAPVMIWMAGLDKLCTYFNEQWLEFTGRSLEAELGNGWSEGVHPEDLAGCLKVYTEAFDRREPFRMEYRLRRHDSNYRWVLDQGVPRFNAERSFAGYVGSAIDITDHKRAEEVLSSMSQRLIEAQETERARLARELHDDISQRAAALAMQLNSVAHSEPSGDAGAGPPIQELGEQAVGLARDLQAVSRQLHSSRFELQGLTSAAKGLCRELSERQNVEVSYREDGLPEDLPKDLALCLFRVLQEAVTNAVKHSGARDIQVSLIRGVNEIELTVQDSGIGFDPERAISGGGLGLTSMRERLKLVHGQLEIHSKPGLGTTLRARVPFSPTAKHAAAAG
jgi:PAS domain S-box-containing protein